MKMGWRSRRILRREECFKNETVGGMAPARSSKSLWHLDVSRPAPVFLLHLILCLSEIHLVPHSLYMGINILRMG